jgi:hypothetical protein
MWGYSTPSNRKWILRPVYYLGAKTEEKEIVIGRETVVQSNR